MNEVAPVLNCTGVVLHTGLGRAPLHPEVAAAMRAAAGAATVEIEPDSGRRGQRQDVVGRRLERLLGQPGCAFNNNAAATLICLAACCAPKNAVVGVSRLVAIGGSFEMPAVMARSGCGLVEVGSVNRTTVEDYVRAVDTSTGAIFAAHRSNFRLEGNYREPNLAELAAVAHEHGLPLIYDQGSGLLESTPWSGTASTVRGALADGADLVCFSGDKLFGGPQAGLIVGRRELVERCIHHPLARAARLDKTMLAGLAALLELYLAGRQDELPTLRLLGTPAEELHRRAELLSRKLRESSLPGVTIEVTNTVGRAGSGALPLVDFPGAGLLIEQAQPNARELARRCRRAGVYGRVVDDRLLLDLRSLPPENDETLCQIARGIMTGGDL